MKRTSLIIALWAMWFTPIWAQKSGSEQQLAKEAQTHYADGDFLKAYPIYSQLVSLHPQNADYLFRFGACAIYADSDKSKAINYLNAATRKEVKDPMAWYYLGKAYHLNYQFRDAVSAYETFMTKADPKLAARLGVQRDIETSIYGSNLLSNIKDIQVLSKVEADRQNFFRYMNLDGVGGRILTVPDELLTPFDKKQKEKGVIHYPGNSTTIYFSSYGKDGSTGKDIYRATIQPDGKFSIPEKIKGDVNTKYDEDFCFMHSDGKTLYFSSKGHNSMGGYDIFKSVYDPATDRFGPPVNLDFAINTPDDDLFFIADSLNQRAYFASARATDQRHIHVYGVRVQSMPMQIIYLKGEFLSEFDASQRGARIQIKDDLSGRIVMEGSSESRSGGYVLYVPRAGNYTFSVRAEGSPIIHQAGVEIPSFEKPVVLKQEMRLVNQGGQEKLLITNFFEFPLDEDIATLAADMLRQKSRLDVNTSEEDAPLDSPVAVAVERDMKNTALAAGFAEGSTAATVVENMRAEVKTIEQFVNRADDKKVSAYAFAQKKLFEAEAALAQAEMLRETTGNYRSEEDLAKAREMMKMLAKAEELQREARAAFTSAEAVEQSVTSEMERANALRNSLEVIRKAESEGDFDSSVRELMKEKERQNKMRETAVTPLDELVAKAKARESELRSAEEHLSRLRDDEKRLSAELRIAESKVNTAKKKSDKLAAENELIAIQSDLDSKRRQLVQEKIRTEEIGARVKDAMASAQFFQRLLNDTELGLTAAQRKPLDSNQKELMSSKINAMDMRIESLQISDPQMLALITEDMASQPVAQVAETTPKSNVTADRPGSTVRSSEEITNTRTEALNRIPASEPGLLPAKRMILNNTIEELNREITAIERRKAKGISVIEKNELDALIRSRNEAMANLNDLQNPVAPASPETARAIYTAVYPMYPEHLQSALNAPGSELERTMNAMEVRREVLDALQSERRANAEAALNETEPRRIAERAERDQELTAAILTLESEIGNILNYRAAFEGENKEIIESNLSVAERLDSQVALTESYLRVLDAMEKEQQAILAVETNREASVGVRIKIGELKKEMDIAEAKLASYRQDLSLTTSASGPQSSAPVRMAPVYVTLEDELEVEENTRIEGANKLSAKMTEAEIARKVSHDAETIKALFKPKAESESIFAYETGELQKLLDEYDADRTKVRNTDKIRQLNEQIFLIEAEIENESNPSKQRKLDRKAEDLYFRKALIEIGNASAIQEIMASEYNLALKEANSFKSEKAELINSRSMIRDEVNKLMNTARNEFEEAQDLRRKAEFVNDDIEKNDYYRRAFAKEQLAISLLNQTADVGKHMDMLAEYDDAELTELRYGNPSAVSEAMTEELLSTSRSSRPSAAQTAETIAVSNDVVSETPISDLVSDGSEISQPERTTVASTQAAADTRIGSAQVNSTQGTDVVSGSMDAVDMSDNAPGFNGVSEQIENERMANVGRDASAEQNVVNTVRSVARAENPATSASSAQPAFTSGSMAEEPVNTPRSSSEIQAGTSQAGSTMGSGSIAATPVNTPRSSEDSNEMVVVNTPNERSGNASSTAETGRSEMPSDRSSATSASTTPSTVPANSASTPSMTSREMSTTPAVAPATAAAKTASPALMSPAERASAEAYDDRAASAYYYEFPSVLSKDLFVMTGKSVYSDSRPIPVDPAMPSGVYYKVQVGAFRNRIPQNLFGDFAPVSGEALANGITRYTAGFFLNFENADQAKLTIRRLGYGDAFVVAFRDGKRIPLYEAMNLTEKDYLAAVEKEYIYGDKGEAPVRKLAANNVAGTATTGAASSANAPSSVAVAPAAPARRTDYYKGTPNAVPAKQVEAVKGLFYTVQIGVYSKPVTAQVLKGMTPVNSELTSTMKIRYTTGVFNSLDLAVNKREEAKAAGITDAFITVYYNGERITLSEADELIKTNGPSIFARP